MQLLSNFSRYLILTVLSGSLLIIWLGYTMNMNSIGDDVKIAAQPATSTQTVWENIVRHFKLDHQTERTQVQKEIRKLLADQNRFNQILQAAGPYIYFIFKTTQAHGLPAELALIPFIESEFNPNDRSTKGATGLWQLMPQTARELGVKVKSGYDGRRNVVASTQAAMTYFNDLSENFNGNWYLAIAAYNAGPGRIISATKRSGTKSFWQLRLPQETKLYLPRLLAVAAILENPEKYGVQLPPINNEPYFTEMTVKQPVTLDKVAKSTDTNLKTLHKLNPDIKHKSTPQKNGEHKILIPVKSVKPLSNTGRTMTLVPTVTN